MGLREGVRPAEGAGVRGWGDCISVRLSGRGLRDICAGFSSSPRPVLLKEVTLSSRGGFSFLWTRIAADGCVPRGCFSDFRTCVSDPCRILETNESEATLGSRQDGNFCLRVTDVEKAGSGIEFL